VYRHQLFGSNTIYGAYLGSCTSKGGFRKKLLKPFSIMHSTVAIGEHTTILNYSY